MFKIRSFIHMVYHLISGKERANGGLPGITDDEIWIYNSYIRSKELPTNQQLNQNSQPSYQTKKKRRIFICPWDKTASQHYEW